MRQPWVEKSLMELLNSTCCRGYSLTPTTCKRLLGMVGAACGGDVAEARDEVSQSSSGTLLAQVVIVLRMVVVTSVRVQVQGASR